MCTKTEEELLAWNLTTACPECGAREFISTELFERCLKCNYDTSEHFRRQLLDIEIELLAHKLGDAFRHIFRADLLLARLCRANPQIKPIVWQRMSLGNLRLFLKRLPNTERFQDCDCEAYCSKNG